MSTCFIGLTECKTDSKVETLKEGAVHQIMSQLAKSQVARTVAKQTITAAVYFARLRERRKYSFIRDISFVHLWILFYCFCQSEDF
nr:unnamed protein product [Fasciola hepatica]